MISQPVIPNIKGKDKFEGPCFHSSRWPQEGLDYQGKKIGIIGCGASTVQMLPIMAKTAEIYTFLILEYLILILIVSFLVRRLEKKMKKDRDRKSVV